MPNTHQKIYARIGITIDIALTVLVFAASYYIRGDLLLDSLGELSIIPNYFNLLFIIVIVWHTTYYFFGVHKITYKTSYDDISLKILKSNLIGLVTLNFLLYFLKIPDVSRLLQIIFCFLNVTTLTLYKILLIRWRRRWRLNDRNLTNILFIGSNKATEDIAQRIIQQHGGEYRIVGCLADGNSPKGVLEKGNFKTFKHLDDLEDILKEYVIDEIVISSPVNHIRNFDKCLSLCEESGATIRFMPDFDIAREEFQPKIGTINFQYFCDLPALTLSSTPKENDTILLKYFLDYILSAVILLLCLPTFLIISLAIKLVSKGPVFFTQTRTGLYGRTFKMYKFRTMVENAENIKNEIETLNESDGPVFKIKNDPRIIPYIGEFLRKTGLDELPQLFNVLRGEMSLVGPRPPIPAEVEKYDFWQRRRLSMKPGISCLWQIHPNRNDISFTDWMKMDLEYIDAWSFTMDIKILIRTVFTLIRAEGR